MLKPDKQFHCNRVAVFSDIHSNYFALKACFEDARKEGADCFVFLGDYVSGLSEVRQTLDLVYEIEAHYPTVCISGNRERYMRDHKAGVAHLQRNLHDSSYLYTYEKLTEKDFAFFDSMPYYDVIQINGTVLEIAHATKLSDRFFFEKEDLRIDEVFSQMTASFLLTGHSHKPYTQTKENKTIINPGSVGLPQGNCGFAQYALLDIEKGVVHCSLRAIPYDYKQPIHAQFASGLIAYAKYWAISDLYNAITGKEYTKQLLNRIYAAEEAHPGAKEDEAVWAKAAKELEMCLTENEIMALVKDF